MNPSAVSCCFRPLPSVLINYRAHDADTTEKTPMQVVKDFNGPSTIFLAAVNVFKPHRCLSPATFLPLHLAQCLSTPICELASFSNAVLVSRHAPLPPCHLFSCSCPFILVIYMEETAGVRQSAFNGCSISCVLFDFSIKHIYLLLLGIWPHLFEFC